MKSMTIHKIDDVLAERLEALARERGESLNATMKGLLCGALGIGKGAEESNRGYRKFLGRWSEEEAAEFERATLSCRQIDPGDWAQ